MQPLAIDLALLRDVLVPGVQITPGRTLAARVVTADGAGRGSLSIAGFLLDVELPRHVHAGEQLRLTVQDVSAQRVLLTMSAQAPPAATAVPLPGGGTLAVREDGDEDGGSRPGDGAGHALSLRYDAPTLGPIDLRFESGAGGTRVIVALAAGEPLALARGAGDELRAALADALAAPASVTIQARRDPVDVYA